jgi:hypothetical protein
MHSDCRYADAGGNMQRPAVIAYKQRAAGDQRREFGKRVAFHH